MALWSTTSPEYSLTASPTTKSTTEGACGKETRSPPSSLYWQSTPLQRLFRRATKMGHLDHYRGRFDTLRTSLYADDEAFFISPTEGDITTTTHILQSFGNVSGLNTNFHKSTVVPISYDHINLDVLLQEFPAICSNFPIKYLGLPLTHKILRRVDFQPLLDKARSKQAGWQGILLTPAGRTTLVKSVLTSTLI